MQSEKNVLSLVKEKFPGKNNIIDNLFKNDEDFYELCLDFHLCVQNMQRFAENTEDDFWVQEYKDLRKDLETELTWFISESKPVPGFKSFKYSV